MALFQSAATVHHGGAGTSTAALRGGVPTIVTPVFRDQYDFSFVVQKLGIGVGFQAISKDSVGGTWGCNLFGSNRSRLGKEDVRQQGGG